MKVPETPSGAPGALFEGLAGEARLGEFPYFAMNFKFSEDVGGYLWILRY
ncbi:hypothetical protein ACRQV7_15260 [Caproiciproducens sp. R2]